MGEILVLLLKEVKDNPAVIGLAGALLGALIYKQGTDDQAARQNAN